MAFLKIMYEMYCSTGIYGVKKRKFSRFAEMALVGLTSVSCCAYIPCAQKVTNEPDSVNKERILWVSFIETDEGSKYWKVILTQV